MKKHMGKRILAIALAAAMMSSVVDYSCVMEVHAEESSNESVNTDEAAEVTEESNETAEITEDTGDMAETVAEEEAVTTEENETATEEDAENGVTEPEVTVESEKTDAASEPDDVETKPAAEPTEETTVVESQKAIPEVSSEVTLSEAMQTENSQAEVSTEDTGETLDQKDAEQEKEEQTLTVEETAEIDPEILEQLPDNDELFAGHVEQVLYGNEDVSTYADYGKSKFTGINRSIYEKLRTFVKNIADNGGNAVYTWKGDLGITWSSDKEGTELENEVSQKFNENIQINEIISTILVDCPYEMYWYDKTKSANIRYGYYSKNGSVKITNLELLCTPVAAYKGTDANEVDSSKASAASVAAENAQAIVTENVSKSDYEKLVAYRKKICELVSYNNAAAEDGYVNTYGYGDPWQLIYVFDKDSTTNVVCEGYSKAFQYLCDLSEFENHTINCYTVTGTMNGGGHMWNIVRMEDNKNYLVDVTNCDTTTNGITAGYPDKLFLAGVSGTVSDGYLASFTNYYGSSSRITYVYDTKTKTLYSTSTDILTLSSANYAVSTVTKNIIDSMVTLSTDSKEYDGNTTEPTSLITVKDEDIILNNDTDYTVTIKKDGISVDQIKNAGTYEITVTGKGAYRGTVTRTYVIDRKSISDVTIESVSDQYYTGAAIEPELTVIDNKKKLEKNVDYTVSYSNNKEVGTAKVVITGVGNYCSTKETSFRIVESEEPIQAVLQGTASITGTAVYGETLTASAAISTSNAGVLTYTWYVNNEQKFVGNTFALKDASFIGKSIRVEVTASNCTGTLFAELSVDKNGSTTVQKGTTPSQPTTPSEPTTPSQPTTQTEPSAPSTPEQPSVPEQPSTPATPTQPEQPSEEPEVEPDTLNVTVGNIKVQSYTGRGITPKITVKDPATRKKLKQGKHYTVSYENNVNVGTAAIVIRGIEANGYSGVKHVYFTIQPQTVAKKMKASAAGKKFLYTGYELTPGVNLTYNKMKLTEGVDYVVSYSNNVEKGTAKIFITGIGNYTGSRTVKFKITGPKLKDAQVSLVENGTAYPDITVTYAGRTLAEGQDYTVKYPKVVKPGNNRIIVRGRGSFSGSVKLTYYVEGL
ncbi:hypothetical protein KFE18_08750 [Clostridiaceae bacterium Marseille-Q4143]|nr:hypothetical protein KFE18_08750 [Clostridiaceae bacterium Marseille-Q4143]